MYIEHEQSHDVFRMGFDELRVSNNWPTKWTSHQSSQQVYSITPLEILNCVDQIASVSLEPKRLNISSGLPLEWSSAGLFLVGTLVIQTCKDSSEISKCVRLTMSNQTKELDVPELLETWQRLNLQRSHTF